MQNKIPFNPSYELSSNNLKKQQQQLSQIQKQIISKYQKLKGYDQTPQYSIQSIIYHQLPKYLNNDIQLLYSQCIYLDKFTFYQMFTILIIQYLYHSVDSNKFRKIHHLKTLIYSDDFLQGNLFTKGLLIKGFKLVQQYSKSKDNIHPLGQYLLTSDFICAFSDCWKELIAKICKQNNIPNFPEDDIDSSIFELFSSYFNVNFNVYWKQKNNHIWKQHFTFDQANKYCDTLALVVNSDYQISVSQRNIKISQNSVLSSSNPQTNTWNYILLTNYQNGKQNDMIIKSQKKQAKISQKPQITSQQQISRISEMDYSCGCQAEQIKILLQDKMMENTTAKKQQKNKKQIVQFNISNTIKKANWLIDNMKKYLQQLQNIKMEECQLVGQTC